VSTISVLGSWIFTQLCDDINLQSKCWPPLCEKMVSRISLRPHENRRQWSVHYFWSCIMDTQSTVHWHWPIINVSAAIMGKNASDDIATTSYKWASREHQQFFVLSFGQTKGYGKALTHNQLISCLYGQKSYWQCRYHLLKMSVPGASMIFGLASWTLKALCIAIDP